MGGVTAKGNRLFAYAVVYKVRPGIPRCDLPVHFGFWHRVYVRSDRWSKKGVRRKLSEQLTGDPDPVVLGNVG